MAATLGFRNTLLLVLFLLLPLAPPFLMIVVWFSGTGTVEGSLTLVQRTSVSSAFLSALKVL